MPAKYVIPEHGVPEQVIRDKRTVFRVHELQWMHEHMDGELSMLEDLHITMNHNGV